MNATGNPSGAVAQRRSRRQFWLAAVIFLGPFIAAFVIYRWFPRWLPSAHTNYGQLIDPPRPLPALTFSDAEGKPLADDPLRRHWSLVYLAGASCEAACQERQHFSRQLWTALNEKRGKLQRIYVAPGAESLASTKAALSGDHPDQQWLAASPESYYNLQRFFETASSEGLYLLDPLGNWVMTYNPSTGPDAEQLDFKGMQKDLKKLLKL